MDTPPRIDVLLVEDNPQDAELIARVIRKRCPDAAVSILEDGAEALDFLFCHGPHATRSPNQRPKVVFLDLKLPKVDGIEVLRQLKRDERTRAIPVVILTSSLQDQDVQAVYQLGANGYVVKPVEYDSFGQSLGTMAEYWITLNRSFV